MACTISVAACAAGAHRAATAPIPKPPAARGATARAASDSSHLEHFIDSYLATPVGRRARGKDPLAQLRIDAQAHAAERATSQLAELRGIDTVRPSVPQRIDWLLLQSTLERTVYDTVLHVAERTPGQYLRLGNIYFRVLGERPPTPTDWVAVRNDLALAPRAMALGRVQLHEPPPLWVKLAVNSASSYTRFLRGDFVGNRTARRLPGPSSAGVLRSAQSAQAATRDGQHLRAEGWALYAEHWMARRGLFKDSKDGQLAQLQMRLWRTARVIIDPSIHTGAMTYDQAVDFFVNEVGLERSAAEAEVNRFTTWPTQAPSYIVGWLEIERMKSELQRELGPRFDEKQFVERVLDQGALPLALLRRAVRNDYGLSN